MKRPLHSDVFTVGLLDQYHLYIPNEIVTPFAEAKHQRVKVKATYAEKSIDFYAALKKDKNTEDYSMMFGKRLQKELGVLQNDYFEMQLFEDRSKYGVDMPEELEAVLLSDVNAYDIFENLTPGKQRSIIYAIIRIKNTQSRIDKSLILCENLKKGKTNPMTLFKP